MNEFFILGVGVAWLGVLALGWLDWQLLRQNGRMLMRLEALEKHLDELKFGDQELPAGQSLSSGISEDENQRLLTSSPSGNGDERAKRFKNHSLARSKLKRDGLKAGTQAPDFRLPRVDGGGDLTLSEFHGQRVLLVFSSPHCGPCNTLAPELEKLHRAYPELQVLMISRGEPKENRAKIKEHGLTFPVVLQQQCEISRLYAMFATPVAYLINETGLIATDVAVGVEPILALMAVSVRREKSEPLLTASSRTPVIL